MTDNTGNTDLEKLRRSFRPEKVKVLFVGESVPAGGTFFYLGNSNLVRYTQEGFSNAYGVQFESIQIFLNRFKVNGFYLEDLCQIPVNNMNNIDRRRTCKESVGNFAKRLGKLRPEAIITVKRTIEDHVNIALITAKLSDIPNYSLPFPSMGHQRRYVQKLSDALQDLINKKIIGESFL